MRRNKLNLHHPEIKAQIGSLYMNYEITKDSCLHYTMSFLLRRLVFAITVAFINFSIVTQVLISIYGSLILLSYLLLWKPMEGAHYNFLAIFNESILCFCFYSVLLFTEYVGDPSVRYVFGSYFLFVLYVNLGMNLLVLAYEILCQLARSFRRFFHHRRLRKELKARKSQIKPESPKKMKPESP
jgi:hypothetical protein